MVELFKTQDIAGIDSEATTPQICAISSNSLKLIVSFSSGIIRIYERQDTSGKFTVQDKYYKKHVGGGAVTALALQDSGEYSISGDHNGCIHVWSTEEPEQSVVKHYNVGKPSSLSIGTKHILASFIDDNNGTGQTVLIKITDPILYPWATMHIRKGIFSNCTVSEYGECDNPHITYYGNGNIFHEQFRDNSEVSQIVSKAVNASPWSIRRNNAVESRLVLQILSQRKLILWAPRMSISKENPYVLNVSSQQNVRINNSLVMSSVVLGVMFLACIYDNKVNVMEVRRKKSASSTGPKTVLPGQQEEPVVQQRRIDQASADSQTVDQGYACPTTLPLEISVDKDSSEHATFASQKKPINCQTQQSTLQSHAEPKHKLKAESSTKQGAAPDCGRDDLDRSNSQEPTSRAAGSSIIRDSGSDEQSDVSQNTALPETCEEPAPERSMSNTHGREQTFSSASNQEEIAGDLDRSCSAPKPKNENLANIRANETHSNGNDGASNVSVLSQSDENETLQNSSFWDLF